jgi:hypothetical protein
MSGPIVLGLRLLLALALYAFLAGALWIIWLELRKTGLDIAGRRTPVIRFQVGSPAGDGRSLHFSQPEIILGRDPACQIPLDDETVSARHAKLSYHHGQWWVEDLGSTNGTSLNRQKVKTATVLTTGDEISCGQVRLTVDLGNDVSLTHN